MLMPQNLTIYIQPNLNLTLYDPGVIKISYSLIGDSISYEHYWGLLIMSFVLFGGNDDHIAFFENTTNISFDQSDHSPKDILAYHRHKLGYLHYMRGPHLIAYDSHYQPDRFGETLDEFLETFEHPGIYDSKDYINYTCHLVGQGEAIIKFKSLDFLQGVVDICTWFNLKISDYVYKLAHNNEPYQIQWEGDQGWIIPGKPELLVDT